jgi:hypothetical protein
VALLWPVCGQETSSVIVKYTRYKIEELRRDSVEKPVLHAAGRFSRECSCGTGASQHGRTASRKFAHAHAPAGRLPGCNGYCFRGRTLINFWLARAGNHHQRLGTEAKRSDFGSRSQTCGGKIMSRESRMLAGILLVVLPTVMFGGLSLLSFLTRNVPGYGDNPLRHDLWRAGHAHAGVYLVLSLVLLRYVDDAVLSPFWKWLARTGAPIAAILIPAAFFLSVAAPTAKQPNALINLAFVGAVFLAAAVISLGVGLIRAGQTDRERHESSTVTAE